MVYPRMFSLHASIGLGADPATRELHPNEPSR